MLFLNWTGTQWKTLFVPNFYPFFPPTKDEFNGLFLETQAPKAAYLLTRISRAAVGLPPPPPPHQLTYEETLPAKQREKRLRERNNLGQAIIAVLGDRGLRMKTIPTNGSFSLFVYSFSFLLIESHYMEPIKSTTMYWVAIISTHMYKFFSLICSFTIINGNQINLKKVRMSKCQFV